MQFLSGVDRAQAPAEIIARTFVDDVTGGRWPNAIASSAVTPLLRCAWSQARAMRLPSRPNAYPQSFMTVAGSFRNQSLSQLRNAPRAQSFFSSRRGLGGISCRAPYI